MQLRAGRARRARRTGRTRPHPSPARPASGSVAVGQARALIHSEIKAPALCHSRGCALKPLPHSVAFRDAPPCPTSSRRAASAMARLHAESDHRFGPARRSVQLLSGHALAASADMQCASAPAPCPAGGGAGRRRCTQVHSSRSMRPPRPAFACLPVLILLDTLDYRLN